MFIYKHESHYEWLPHVNVSSWSVVIDSNRYTIITITITITITIIIIIIIIVMWQMFNSGRQSRKKIECWPKFTYNYYLVKYILDNNIIESLMRAKQFN